MSKLKKTKFEPKLKTLTDKLWGIVRKKVFKQYGKNCYTCPQTNLKGINLQCGHGYSKGALGVTMQYDIRILRPQCYNCNLRYGGMGAVFWKRLETDLGKKEADLLYAECKKSKGLGIKARPFIKELIKKYEPPNQKP